MDNSQSPNCLCAICRNNKDFNVPAHLLEKLRAGDLLIFAGAGISTEKRTVFPSTLYEEVAYEIGIDPNGGADFPALMSAYCKQPDGRQKLLQKIKRRIDYVRSFPELYREATRFHRELSTLFQVDDIVTTNWDDYFERECGATPYVSPEDFSMWNMPGRKVFKIHGSINNLGSIIATTEDYATCYRRLSKGVMGSILKKMLATKTIVYIGYSFSDRDFLKIHKILTSEMRGLRPHAYLVTLDESANELCKGLNITPIITDGAYFISRLKAHIIADGRMVSDDVFKGIQGTLESVSEIHNAVFGIDLKRHPMAIFTLAYQDGLQHAFGRILAMRHTGQYSHECHVRDQLAEYERLRRQCISRKRYFDAAYIEGYRNGLIFLLAPKKQRRWLPVLYVFGIEDHPRNVREYRRLLSRGAAIHKTAYAQAEKIVRKRTGGIPGIGVHHPPFL